jgi:hypothetical protein
MADKKKIRARFIIEVMGKPKEMVTKALKDITSEMKKDGHKIEKDNYSKPKKSGEHFFSAFTEFEILFDNLEDFLGAIVDYMPITVEILEPDKIDIEIGPLQEIINDLTSRLDNFDKQIKVLQATNIILQRKLHMQGQ